VDGVPVSGADSDALDRAARSGEAEVILFEIVGELADLICSWRVYLWPSSAFRPLGHQPPWGCRRRWRSRARPCPRRSARQKRSSRLPSPCWVQRKLRWVFFSTVLGVRLIQAAGRSSMAIHKADCLTPAAWILTSSGNCEARPGQYDGLTPHTFLTVPVSSSPRSGHTQGNCSNLQPSSVLKVAKNWQSKLLRRLAV
jgi:hypothetical protein